VLASGAVARGPACGQRGRRPGAALEDADQSRPEHPIGEHVNDCPDESA
jgi:hypothetical protein